MEIIRQTNRTILFEQFNEEKYNILTLIGDVENIDSLSDEKIEEINKHLLVSSFDEFLEKFEPCIYAYMDVENKKISYTLSKNPNIAESMYSKIVINKENSFLKMLINLIENRKSIDAKNVDFSYETILDMLSPKKIIQDIKQLRKEINYLYDNYEKLGENNPKKLDLGDKLNYKFYEASKNYNNILAMLPLAIEDIKTRLSIGEDKNVTNIDKIKMGYLEFSDKGELEFIENRVEKENKKLLAQNSEKLSLIFKQDYMESNENPQEYVGNLVSRIFVPITTSNIEINYEKEVKNYNQYLEIYKQSQEDFIKITKELIEKILAIKLFFDQYETSQKLMQPKLIITNVENEILLQLKNKDRLEKYLNTVNSKNEFENTIWFAIYPNLSLKETYKENKGIFSSNTKVKKNNLNTPENLSSLMEIMAKYKIQVFVSFEKNEENTFNYLASLGISKYENITKKFENQKYSEYIIPTLPNFTIIPHDKSGIKLDKKAFIIEDKVYFSEKEEDELIFYINGIYVDSSYIAAGLVSAYQCPLYMKQRFSNVNLKNPSVRFNIEENENSWIVRTNLAREISGFTNNIKEEINKNNYGFIFSSEIGHLNKEKISNVTVYKARSLLKNDNGMYESIYKTQTSTYIERILRYITNDFKSDKLNYFFSNSPLSQKSIWQKEIGNVNSILKVGDDISHIIDETNNTCQLNLTFLGEVRNLKIEINKNN